MKTYLLFSLVLFLFILPMRSRGQYYSTGQDPASCKWDQLESQGFRLIYPREFGSRAQRLSSILELVSKYEKPEGVKVPRMPVIIHSRSAYSNGITVWAPRRFELYPCPPQESYPEEWLEQLGIHEYRHAVQLSQVNRGFSKFLFYIFGEQITGGILGLYLPAWYLEGDATVAETKLTSTGRGRSARFEMTLRAQLLTDGVYSYDKATMGSYRTFTPDAYSLGYYLVGHATVRYGQDCWDEAIVRTARYPFMVVPFSSGTRKRTGLWKNGLYRQTMEELTVRWSKQDSAIKPSPTKIITVADPVNYTTYGMPAWLNDTLAIAAKQSEDELPQLVTIDLRSGRQKRVTYLSYRAGQSISASHGKAAWSEFRYDPRWNNRSYAEIMIIDAGSRHRQRLTRKTRYFSPALSPDGKHIAAIRMTEEGNCTLDILDSAGRQVFSHPQPPGTTLMTPAWSPDGTQLSAVILDRDGKSVGLTDMQSGRFRIKLGPTFDDISGPVRFLDNYLVFSQGISGVENAWALDTISGEISMISSSRLGSMHPIFSPGQERMLCNEYQAAGTMVAVSPVNFTARQPGESIPRWRFEPAASLSEQVKINLQDSIRRNLPDSGSTSPPGVKRYRKGLHLFNPHSWAPVSLNASNLSVKPGIMAMSQDVLNTMFIQSGWEYDLNEMTGMFYTGLSYQGLYPVFDIDFHSGNRSSYQYDTITSAKERFTWHETRLKIQARVPLRFSSGRMVRTIEPSLGTTMIWPKHREDTPETFTEGLIQTLDYRFYASQVTRSLPRDMFPRLGQSIDLLFRHSPFSSNDLGLFFTANMNLYFPGVMKHHGIWLYLGYQQTKSHDDLSYTYPLGIRIPRGWSGIREDQMTSLQVNYKFPVICPDLSLGPVLYMKRVKFNLFYDCLWGETGNRRDNYQSAGIDCLIDFHLLRFFAPFEAGLRTVFFPADRSWGLEFLYSVSLP